MDHGKAAAVSLAVCGALLLVGCKHPPVELGHDVKVVCIKSKNGMHLKEKETTFQFGRSPMPNQFRLKEWRHVDFPWKRARFLKRLTCEKPYTWSELQTGTSGYKCFPAATTDRAAVPETATETTSGPELPDPCESTCTARDPYHRVQGYVKLHSQGDSGPMVPHCVQLYDIAASDGRKAGVLMMLYHPEDSAHAGYAHGEEQ